MTIEIRSYWSIELQSQLQTLHLGDDNIKLLTVVAPILDNIARNIDNSILESGGKLTKMTTHWEVKGGLFTINPSFHIVVYDRLIGCHQ